MSCDSVYAEIQGGGRKNLDRYGLKLYYIQNALLFVMKFDICKFNFITYFSEQGNSYLLGISLNIFTRREQEGNTTYFWEKDSFTDLRPLETELW